MSLSSEQPNTFLLKRFMIVPLYFCKCVSQFHITLLIYGVAFVATGDFKIRPFFLFCTLFTLLTVPQDYVGLSIV